MQRPEKEERINAITHGLATALAVGGTVWMLVRASQLDNWLVWLACLLYGAALVGLFTSSTLSHIAKSEESLRWYRQLDQAFIYFLIVATYTPLSVAHLNTTYYWVLLAAMWLVAVTGFVSKLWRAHRVDSVSILGYVALGWMPALGGVSALRLAPAGAFWGILGGGVLYTVGTYFLINDTKAWYFHAIWHLFVLAGAAVHWWTTMVYVV